MRILIVYGTTEGHTRELSEFAAAALREAGHEVQATEAPEDATVLDPAAWDAVIVAASLHMGRYQPAVVRFIRMHRDTLADMPSAFISISLSAAGANPDDRQGLEQCVARFRQETLWTPRAVPHAAGAIRYSHYDFFKRRTLKFIARQRGKETVTSRDYDLTDYEALKRFVIGFARTADLERVIPVASPVLRDSSFPADGIGA